MKDIQQLIKKNSQEGRYEDIFPKTFIDAVTDKETREPLGIILNRNNFLFLTYVGSESLTRLQVPMSYRRSGLWVAYQKFDKTLVVEFFKGDYIDNDHWGQDIYWFPYNTAEYQPHSVDLRALAQDVYDYIANSISTADNNLHTTISQETDDKINTATQLLPEDLSKVDGKIQFADRQYDANNFSGLGHVILRRNIVDGKNVLTQAMINKPNTVYEIRYDFDLNNQTIIIPEGCVLDFQGGSISNGTLIGNNTIINAGLEKIFGININIGGSYNVKGVLPEWFGAKGDGINNDYTSIKYCIEFISAFKNTIILNCEYLINDTINLPNNSNLIFNGNASIIYDGDNVCLIIDTNCYINKLTISRKVLTQGLSKTGTGIKVLGVNNLVNDISISDFNIGIYLLGDNKGCAYNKLSIIILSNCVKYVVLETSGDSGYVNENIFNGGRFFISSSYANSEETYGIIVSTSNNHIANSNKFIGCSLESLKRNITVIDGRNNLFLGCRIESNITEWFYMINKVNIDSYNNIIIAGYTGGSSSVPIIQYSVGKEYSIQEYPGRDIVLGGDSFSNLGIASTIWLRGDNRKVGLSYTYDNRNLNFIIDGNIIFSLSRSGINLYWGTLQNTIFPQYSKDDRPMTYPNQSATSSLIYDTTLEKLIMWKKGKWYNLDGTIAENIKGTTDQRPTLTSTDEGFEYYDSTLKKKILWNGTVWVNLDGTSLN